MTIFVQQGDAPLDAAQLAARTQAFIARDWPEWRRQRSIRLGDGAFNSYMDAVAADTDANRAANDFNLALAAYRAAADRLARYSLAEGRPEITEAVETGERDSETGAPILATIVIQSAIEPLPADDPAVIADAAERAEAQAIVDASDQQVKDFGDEDHEDEGE